MNIGKHNFNRVSKNMPCPVCGKPDWCLVRDDGNYAICTRTPSRSTYKAFMGYGHRLGTEKKFQPVRKVIKTKDVLHNIEKVNLTYATYDFHIDALAPLAADFEVGSFVLLDMGVGYDKKNTFCFPMVDSTDRIIGVSKRNLAGKKWCLKGSRLGIFKPRLFYAKVPAYICEGASDTAVLTYRKYNVIGRMSAYSSVDILVKLLRTCPEINIVSDYDATGIGYRESCKLAEAFGRPVNIIMNRNYKDIREWIQSGTFTEQEFLSLKKVFLT